MDNRIVRVNTPWCGNRYHGVVKGNRLIRDLGGVPQRMLKLKTQQYGTVEVNIKYCTPLGLKVNNNG